jgi:H+-transporting ATPase
MLAGATLAALVLLLSFTVFFTGRNLRGLPLAQLQTLVFVMLVATGQGNGDLEKLPKLAIADIFGVNSA